ncbi:hypothetical protein CC86DRAFT_317324 [Ophiobolus disseminans]|uniref:Uncharacterized protein n=1 Tax=Ophiobolus disseminans TaxID=1469910 RepID=A0A6A7A9I0_9PLEO|nr:hypothetical protein CC86DRAFT_317324 [Ophiobolus disseminans]
MPHATSDASTSAVPSVAQDKISQHLTESILTLQQTIRNIREDVRNGIAPSILMPADSDPSVENGMVFLSLEPSTSTVESNIVPLDERLHALETKLHNRDQWHPPATPPKSPEYSIIDIADLSSAIKLLEDIFQHAHPSKPLSPQPSFAGYTWRWDPRWKEFYTHVPNESSFVYLSRWRLHEQQQIWEHVSMNSADLLPDDAAELLGSWDDWAWDPMWKEWYLDVSDEEERTFVYASRWQVQESGEWMYVGRRES